MFQFASCFFGEAASIFDNITSHHLPFGETMSKVYFRRWSKNIYLKLGLYLSFTAKRLRQLMKMLVSSSICLKLTNNELKGIYLSQDLIFRDLWFQFNVERVSL